MSSSTETSARVRRRSNGRRTRAEIIAAAERRFAERGFQDTRLGDVAADVGIRRPSLSYHFSDKDALYTAVLQAVFADWSEALPTRGTAVERLEGAMDSWIDFVAERPTAARLLLQELANAHPEKIAAFLRLGGAPIRWFETVIGEGAAAGELDPMVEPHRFMSLMAAIAVVQFATIPWLSLRVPADPDEREELERRKHEILVVARTLLGYETEPVANRPTRTRAGAEERT